MSEPTYTHAEVLRTIGALVDAAGGTIIVERRFMDRANEGMLTVQTDPQSGAMCYRRLVPETFR